MTVDDHTNKNDKSMCFLFVIFWGIFLDILGKFRLALPNGFEKRIEDIFALKTVYKNFRDCGHAEKSPRIEPAQSLKLHFSECVERKKQRLQLQATQGGGKNRIRCEALLFIYN